MMKFSISNIFVLFVTLCISIIAIPTASFTTPALHNQQRPLAFTQLSEKEASASDVAAASAEALTEFMARAHEEKVRAMASVEAKYKDKIAELEAKIEELEKSSGAPSGSGAVPTSGNSYAFPVTNKDLTEKILNYQTFISDYIVSAQHDKLRAVAVAEKKVHDMYEALFAKMQEPDELQ